MTIKKILPQTLLNLHENPLMKKIMDGSEDLTKTIESVRKLWSFDMYSRTPSMTIEDGNVAGTNLDVACLMYTLAERSATITIPKYKSLRPKTLNESKVRDKRSGEIASLSSNKDLFSFSVKIFDESVNDYRNFCITDPNGDLYLDFDFEMTDKEEKFLEKNKVTFSDQIKFKYFVHPNRWASLYGQNYFITKALIERMTDECKNWFIQIKRMQKNGIMFPAYDSESKPWSKKLKEYGKSVKFSSLEVEVDFPMINKYKVYEDTSENLIELDRKRKLYIYSILPILRFAIRCTELAFYKYSNDKMPSWIGGGSKWESGFKLPKKRIVWDRLKIIQPAVGKFSIAIRKRIKDKSEIMALDYEEKT